MSLRARRRRTEHVLDDTRETLASLPDFTPAWIDVIDGWSGTFTGNKLAGCWSWLSLRILSEGDDSLVPALAFLVNALGSRLAPLDGEAAAALSPRKRELRHLLRTNRHARDYVTLFSFNGTGEIEFDFDSPVGEQVILNGARPCEPTLVRTAEDLADAALFFTGTATSRASLAKEARLAVRLLSMDGAPARLEEAAFWARESSHPQLYVAYMSSMLASGNATFGASGNRRFHAGLERARRLEDGAIEALIQTKWLFTATHLDENGNADPSRALNDDEALTRFCAAKALEDGASDDTVAAAEYWLRNFEALAGGAPGTMAEATDATFWNQADCVNGQASEPEAKDARIGFLVDIYRDISIENPERFANSQRLSNELLRSRGFKRLVRKGCYVTAYGPDARVPLFRDYVFILRNLDKLSTLLIAEDHVAISFGDLENEGYYKLALRYFMSMPSVSVVTSGTLIGYVADSLAFLDASKRAAGSTPDFATVTDREGVMLREFCMRKGAPHARIPATRAFLDWAKNDQGAISYRDSLMSYLTAPPDPPAKGGASIPDEDLLAIDGALGRAAEHSLNAALSRLMLHILIQTELRPSELLRVSTDAIVCGDKPNEYLVLAYSKTTRGWKGKNVITERTRRLFSHAQSITQPLRDRCANPEVARYVFLTEVDGVVRPMGQSVLKYWLKKACREAGCRRYTPGNIRDTHMTKALEFTMREGLGEAELAILTRHRRVDTTTSHYVEQSILSILESDCGIIIGGDKLAEAGKKVVAEIPADRAGIEYEVENGCGSCAAGECRLESIASCLICPDFVTDPSRRPYFVNAIRKIDGLLPKAPTQHDREDLVAIKGLHAAYVAVIDQMGVAR